MSDEKRAFRAAADRLLILIRITVLASLSIRRMVRAASAAKTIIEPLAMDPGSVASAPGAEAPVWTEASVAKMTPLSVTRLTQNKIASRDK
jgi:hypothetical protein